MSQILDRGETWLVPLEIVFSVLRLESALNWNRFLSIQRRGLNSLNSVSGKKIGIQMNSRFSSLFFFC